MNKSLYFSIKDKKKVSWGERMETSEAKWRELREDLLEAGVKRYAIPSTCLDCDAIPEISCVECGFLCRRCDDKVHLQNPLHNRSLFLNGDIIPLSVTEHLTDSGVIEETGWHYTLHFQ